MTLSQTDLPAAKIAAILTDEVADGTLAVAPLPPASEKQGDNVSLHAVPTDEYVASPMSGGWNTANAYARSLPEYIDDLSNEFGADIYERMSLDAHVAGEVNNYKLSVLAGGVRLLPAFADSRTDVEMQRKHAVAESVRQFCESVVNELETPVSEVLDDLLDAFGQGHRLAEVVYRRDGSFLVPSRLAMKHRRTYAYVTDGRGRMMGILAALAGRAETQVMRSEIIIDPAHTPNLLPASKFLRLSWRPKNGDPRGTSALRPAYAAWWQKRQTEVELARFVAQFAGSGILITMGENAKPTYRRNPDGSVAKNADGDVILDHPQDMTLAAAQNYKNGSVLIVPPGYDAKNLVTPGAGAPFFAQIERCNSEMSKAILGQALATNEGKHQTRAATGSHKDVMDVLVSFGEQAVCAALRRFLKIVVEINFGADYVPFTPHVSLSTAEEADVESLSRAYSGIGYKIAPEHLPEVDAKLGLPARTEEAGEVATEDEEQEDSTDEKDRAETIPNGKKKRSSPGLLTLPSERSSAHG